MKTTIDYSESPAKAFDAVQDVIQYLGERYARAAKEMKRVKSPKEFSFCCGFIGIEGFPVAAWYEHFHGEGSWDKAWNKLEERT